jgi:lysophospholipase L1-like esterase
MGPLVRALRKAHPRTPIILAEDRSITTDFVTRSWREYHAANRAALRRTFQALRAEGLDRIYYVEGDGVLGADGEGTADTSHPTDLGMMRLADRYEPVLRAALRR